MKSLPILALLGLPSFALGQTILPDGATTVSGKLSAGGWARYALDVRDADGLVQADVRSRAGAVELYARRGAAPTPTDWDWRSSAGREVEPIVAANDSEPALTTGRLYVYVHSVGEDCAFTLRVRKARVASVHPGMGAFPFAAGTAFRVWAPFASSVSVAGSFNGWSATAAPLTAEGNGNWSLDLRGAGMGAQYKYVLKNGAQTLWRNDPRARALTNSAGNSLVVGTDYPWSSEPYASPPWDKTVVYQLHVGAFNDAPGGGPGGFDSVVEKLDDLKDLGVTTLQLLPVQEFPGDFSWGYNPSYPFSVESAYGGPAKLKRLIDEAHRRGLAVMLDVVDNHLGPNDLDLWRFDGWSQNNLGGIYFYNDARAATPWGDTRPDYGRGEVRQYLRDAALQWLEEYRADGLRFDSTVNVRRSNVGDLADGWSLLQWIDDEVDARQPWKLMVAEDMQGDAWITRPTAQGGAGFDAQWSAGFVHAVRDALTKTDDADRSMVAIRDAVASGAEGRRVVYTESHDEDANGHRRLPSEIDPSNPGGYWARRRATLGMALVLTTPGVPMLFMGQEFMESGAFSDSNPLDWSKRTTYSGVRQMVKDLIALRKTVPGLTGDAASVFHADDANKVVAFRRWKEGSDVVVVQNWANRAWDDYRVGLPAGGRWRVVFSSDWTGYCPDFSNAFNPDADADPTPWDGLGFSRSLRLAPYSTVILVRS